MKIKITINGTSRMLERVNPGDKVLWTIDGHSIDADAIEVSPGNFSVLIDGESIEVRVEESNSNLRVIANGKEYVAAIVNPRSLQKKHLGAGEIEGRQAVAAPMAGKIIRMLVRVGDEVQLGQGLLIVEAMKMQNEIRSPKSGKVERLAVLEGQAVNPGDTVAVII